MDAARDILVIKRGRGGGDEGHHGGVWKIAYADFMTAMMAFFLVMWLINAANEETRAQVASYFNPVKLVDTVGMTKGVQVPKTGSSGDEQMAKLARTKGKQTGKYLPPNAEPSPVNEENMFRDPYVVLRNIASELGPGRGAYKPAPSTDLAQGSRGGEAYRDPFDPDFWAAPELPPPAGEKEAAPRKTAKADSAAPDQSAPAKASPDKANPDKAAPETGQTRAAALKKQIDAAIGEAGLPDTPDIQVKPGPDGLLLSVTDKFDFGMFAISSARPGPELVHVMDRIAAVLKKHKGELIIRGHTDARPFTSGKYDNWRLSTARAHMAYHMLVRGGIEPQRITRIEGYADRMLKLKDAPNAAQNRRIEILIRKPKT